MSEPFVWDKHPAPAAAARPIARPLLRGLLVVLPFLVLASYQLFDERLLGYHHYRQAHDALMARTFATTTLNPMFPAIDGVTWGKALYLNDFPLYPWLVGMAWRISGESLLTARLLSLTFGLLALLAFRRLVLRVTADARAADLATAILGMMPVCAWFLRTVQRQSLFLLLLLLALERGLAWLDEGRGRARAAATAALALAVLLNPFAVYAFLPLADRIVRREGWRALLRRDVVLSGLAAVLPAALWYGRVVLLAPTLATAEMVAVTAPVAHRDFLDPARYLFWTTPPAILNLFRTITEFVLPVATSLAVGAAGVLVTRRLPSWRFLRVWLLAVALYFFLDYYPIAAMVHQYYYLNLAPPAAAFAAAGFLALQRWTTRAPAGSHRRLALAGAAGLFVLGAIYYTARMADNDWHAEYYSIAERLEQAVPRGARVQIVAGSDDPLFSYVLDPGVRHRLRAYTPQVLERLLEDRDFDYLAVVYDRGALPPWPALHRIRTEGFDEVCTTAGLLVYRRTP